MTYIEEFAATSPRFQSALALRSLARHTGLALRDVVELADKSRLGELFDAETRELKSPAELRSLARETRSLTVDGRAALAEMEARHPSQIDPRAALEVLKFKRERWTT